MGSLNPWGLLFGLSIIPIIYLYFIKQEKTVLEVSSIIPWKYLEEERSSSKEKFSLDILLLLQILVIMVIMLMLMRLYYLDTVKVYHRVLIMDASASMKTREPDGLFRLDKAKEEAYELIGTMGPDDRMMIIRMARTPEKLSEFISDKGQLVDIVKSIQAGDTETNFRAALSLALPGIQGLEGGRIYVFGDRSRDSQDVHHLLGGMVNADERLIFTSVGENNDNAAITSLDIYQSVYEKIKKKIYITIRNFSSAKKDLVLKVFIGGMLVFRENVSLSANDFRIMPFGNIKESGLLKVEIEGDDALLSDNKAYGLIRENKAVRLLLVTEDEQFIGKIDRISRATKSMQATPVFPEEFPNINLENFDIALFHKAAPNNIPQINSVFFDPPPDNTLFDVSSELVENPTIIDWNRKHPSLKYLNFLDTIDIKQVHKIGLPPWAIELVRSQGFPLAFWGTYQDYKKIVFSFDLSDHFFPPSQDITGLILFLNLIDWMTPAQVNIRELRTGSKYFLESEGDFKVVHVEKPDGTVVEIKKEGDRFVFDDTEMVGIYKVEAVREDGTNQVYRFFTNLLDENESRIEPAVHTAIPVTSKVSPTIRQQKQQYEIWRYFIWLALVFLMVEWWVYFKRVE
jgi:hypothetical protein